MNDHLPLRVASRRWLLRAGAAALSLGASGCISSLLTAANVPAHFSSVRRQRDLRYGPLPRQTLDVYGGDGPPGRPVAVFWYGGAWSQGSKAQYRFVGTALAERGVVAVLPDYRIYPQARFPDFIEDGAAAVAFVREQALQWGGDPTRIVLMGHSAGAHLAAMLALAPAYLAAAGVTQAQIAGWVGMSGPYALVPDDAVLRSIFAAPYRESDWQPLRFASATAPPTLLLHGLRDQRVLPIQSQQLHDALSQYQVPVNLHWYPTGTHATPLEGFVPPLERRVDSLSRILAFIHTGLRVAPSALSGPVILRGSANERTG